ncbi:MAG: hypothetical protein Q7R47_02670 [Candidatus Diapherotrites archaeon]|nr:hypothetical protein [Candidatus Diapherotrites archaeon]
MNATAAIAVTLLLFVLFLQGCTTPADSRPGFVGIEYAHGRTYQKFELVCTDCNKATDTTEYCPKNICEQYGMINDPNAGFSAYKDLLSNEKPLCYYYCLEPKVAVVEGDTKPISANLPPAYPTTKSLSIAIDSLPANGVLLIEFSEAIVQGIDEQQSAKLTRFAEGGGKIVFIKSDYDLSAGYATLPNSLRSLLPFGCENQCEFAQYTAKIRSNGSEPLLGNFSELPKEKDGVYFLQVYSLARFDGNELASIENVTTPAKTPAIIEKNVGKGSVFFFNYVAPKATSGLFFDFVQKLSQ